MRIYQVDSFADKVFEGNPAGVCIVPGPADEAWMQSVAMEMNLSETAFLYKTDEGYNLRWFTPQTEVDLCGHATLASAHILWETGELHEGQEAAFFTKSGRLSAKRSGEFIILDFPAEEDMPAAAPDALRAAFQGTDILYCGRNRMDYIVQVANDNQVKALRPDMQLLKTLGQRGVIVTSASSDPAYDFVSRFFAPGAGILEDPVTGSDNWARTVFWLTRPPCAGGSLRWK
jgi:PhzF family phenazine biosynthesis protein